MSQVSPPLRIALVATIAFVAIWMLVLRPAPAEVAETPVDPVATVAAGATPAAAAAPATAAAPAPGATTATPPATSTSAVAPAGAPPVAPVSRAALDQLPRDVARAVRRDQVIALLFWNSSAPEDRRVRRALRGADVYGNRVFVKTAGVEDISRYAPITRGAEVEQAPTIVVVDAERRAESLVGYVARTTIRQALSDALRAGR